MTKENKYYPFTISVTENTFSLLLTDLKWDAFEKSCFMGNGHDWNRLIKNLCLDKQPEIIQNLEFDSEADMFCVRSQEEASLAQIADIASSFYDDENLLLKKISKYAQYE